MKSIKQQYIDLREGNMTQANFMRNLRMTLPQYVTNLSSFDDSVKILKNKGILTEADSMIGSEDSYDYQGKTVNIDPQSASKIGDTAKLYDQEQNEYVGEVVSVDPTTGMIHVDPNSIKPDGVNTFFKRS